MDNPQEIIKKICVLGDPSVGKTSLIRRFVYNQFDDKYISTIGTRVSNKLIEYPEQNTKLTLMVWDILGQKSQRYSNVYFRGSKGAIIVADITQKSSLESIKGWADNFYAIVGQVPIIFVANKFDLRDQKSFDLEDYQEIVNEFNWPLFPASAKNGMNVEEIFNNLGMLLL